MKNMPRVPREDGQDSDLCGQSPKLCSNCFVLLLPYTGSDWLSHVATASSFPPCSAS